MVPLFPSNKKSYSTQDTVQLELVVRLHGPKVRARGPSLRDPKGWGARARTLCSGQVAWTQGEGVRAGGPSLRDPK